MLSRRRNRKLGGKRSMKRKRIKIKNNHRLSRLDKEKTKNKNGCLLKWMDSSEEGDIIV